jgi:5-methylcytosine-specific restriction endonuclease McrA
MDDLYSSLRWRELRAAALSRDSHRCVAAWLLGGECSDRLDVHHIEPADERPDLAFSLSNLITVCSSHHKRLEALRNAIRRARAANLPWKRCPHSHPTREGRLACERRLNRERVPA